jgi:hypothetical protein
MQSADRLKSVWALNKTVHYGSDILYNMTQLIGKKCFSSLVFAVECHTVMRTVDFLLLKVHIYILSRVGGTRD